MSLNVTIQRDSAKETKIMSCIEIKTQTNENNIVAAEEALVNHGSVIYYYYNTGVFKDFMPSVSME